MRKRDGKSFESTIGLAHLQVLHCTVIADPEGVLLVKRQATNAVIAGVVRGIPKCTVAAFVQLRRSIAFKIYQPTTVTASPDAAVFIGCNSDEIEYRIE